MIRVLLINPPSPERLGAPLLGQQYLAASLLADGYEVRVVDAAARHFAGGHAAVLAAAHAFDPHIVGIALFTRWVWHAYRLVAELRGRFPLLVGGGPHATARPDEVIARGCDVAVSGEAEHILPLLAQHVAGQQAIDTIPGLHYRDRDGQIRRTAPAPTITDLDALPTPLEAQSLYDRRWYDADGARRPPGGILASRGCPARCTFCANIITGRSLRKRGVDQVVAELNASHARWGQTFFPFWDDALTADRRHTLALCHAIESGVRFPLHWSAITRASNVTPEVLHAMRRAGLMHVNFGVESGDDDVLRAIRKGIRTEHVVRALEWARAEGLQTTCNFMLGFPEDTPGTLGRTLAFMQRIAPLTDSFSTLGVAVPFPGTLLYEANHRRFGFTDWWLQERYARYHETPDPNDAEAFHRHYIDDANLDLDFFRYDARTRAMIRDCLRFKAEHNLRAMGWAIASRPEPALVC